MKEDTADWLEEDRKIGFLRAVMSNNVAVAGSHACGNRTGNKVTKSTEGAHPESLTHFNLVDAAAQTPVI